MDRAHWVWAAALALLVSRCVSVEWSPPTCNAPTDGPTYAAYGFPLPYTRFGGASSLEYSVMPHVFLLDLGFAVLLLLPIAKAVVDLIDTGRSRSLLTAAGLSLAIALMALQALDAYVTWWPRTSIAVEGYERYVDYRPVGWAPPNGHVECTPSPFWFGSRGEALRRWQGPGAP